MIVLEGRVYGPLVAPVMSAVWPLSEKRAEAGMAGDGSMVIRKGRKVCQLGVEIVVRS